jgi:hypothetical protein
MMNSAAGRFARHYIEMLVAMAVGMAVLGAVLRAFVTFDQPELSALVMATNMSIGMAVWMHYKGHSWRSILEMSAAMYIPYVLLLPPLWFGVLPEHGLHVGGHLLMLPAMAIAMLLRLEEYIGCPVRAEI